MKVVALDLSLTSTGWARNTESGRELGTIRTKTFGMPRLQEIRRRVLDLSRGADLVVVEGYSFMSKQSQPHSLGELGGIVRLALYEMPIPYAIVAPKSMKKLATGKGNAPKELVLVEAVKRLGFTGSDNNEADALWLLECAFQAFRLPSAVQLPAAHMEALNGIEWPMIVANAR